MHKLENWPRTSQPKRWCQMDSSKIWSCPTTEVQFNLCQGALMGLYPGGWCFSLQFCKVLNVYSFTQVKSGINYTLITMCWHMTHSLLSFVFPLCCREIRCLFLLSTGLHLCLSNWDHRFQWCCWSVQQDWLWSHCRLCWLPLLPFRMVMLYIEISQVVL